MATAYIQPFADAGEAAATWSRVRGNNFATLTYTFPVPPLSSGTTVTIGMFMTDGDRCGDYVTSTWTFNNVGTPAPGVQVIGTVRLEQ